MRSKEPYKFAPGQPVWLPDGRKARIEYRWQPGPHENRYAIAVRNPDSGWSFIGWYTEDELRGEDE